MKAHLKRKDYYVRLMLCINSLAHIKILYTTLMMIQQSIHTSVTHPSPSPADLQAIYLIPGPSGFTLKNTFYITTTPPQILKKRLLIKRKSYTAQNAKKSPNTKSHSN